MFVHPWTVNNNQIENCPFCKSGSTKMKINSFEILDTNVRDDPKLQGYSGVVPISEWSGWQFDYECEIFSLLDKENQLGR